MTERLAIGGDLDSDNPNRGRVQLAALVDAGISHIIDCRVEYSDRRFVLDRAPHIRYLRNGTDDNGTSQPDSFFDHGVAWARNALANPYAKVLAHCHMGINRGPSLGYAILLDQGLDPIEAIEAIETIRAARPVAVADYAIDALSWRLRRTGTTTGDRNAEIRRLRDWLDDHPLDVIRAIRQSLEEQSPDTEDPKQFDPEW